MRKITERLPSLHDPGPAHLWRIGYALAVCFVVAVAGLAVLWLAARALLGNPHIVTSKGISVHDTVGVAQLVFASVAGAGALVALVVAYRRQRVSEVATVEDKDRWETSAAHDRTRVFNERFTAIATQLGDDQSAVGLAGVHAMAGLADDWEENRQTCVDILCAYLRLPYDPDPGEEATPAERAAYLANREVRHTIIRLIGDHLRPSAAVSWQGLNLDFTGVVFDGGDFTLARFSGGIIRFKNASFVNGEVLFGAAEFSGGTITFGGAEFSGRIVDFSKAKFSGGTVDFIGAKFSGSGVFFGFAEFSGSRVLFASAEFSGGQVNFLSAEFSGGEVSFGNARFSGGTVLFASAKFSGGKVDFRDAEFSGGTVIFADGGFAGGEVDFRRAEFSGGTVNFGYAERLRFGKFPGGQFSFGGAQFSGGEVNFSNARFSGGEVDFREARFSGGEVDFRDPRLWSQPPKFDWGDATPPAGVTLPTDASATPT